MKQGECTIVVETIPGGGFRASTPQWPDCSAVAPTAEAARAAVEKAIDVLSRQEQKPTSA